MAGIQDHEYEMYLRGKRNVEKQEINFDFHNPRVNLHLNLPPQSPKEIEAWNNYAEHIQSQDDLIVKKYVGIGVGWTSLVAEYLLSHPFVVLRRQCQVHNSATRYHLIPVYLLPVIIKLHQRQGITTLWKGIGSVLLIKGVSLALEDIISKFTPCPKEVNAHSSLRSFGQHLLLKCFAIITPFYSASLVETVQSEIASEKPGIFDVFREGAYRLFSWGAPTYGRMLPVWALVIPTVSYNMLKYMFGLVVYGSTKSLLQLFYRRTEIRKGAVPKDIMNQPTQQDIEIKACFTRDILADISFYPFETVLHRLHLQGTRTIIDNLDSGYEVTPILTNYQGVVDCLRTIQQEESSLGLYKGFGALLLQYAAQFAIVKLTRVIITEVTYIFRSTSNKPKLIPTPMTPQALPPSLASTPSAFRPITPSNEVRYFYHQE